MPGFLLALLLSHISAGAFQSLGPPNLVETGDADFSARDKVLEIRGSRGWLRTEQLFLNFRVTFDYRATTPDANPGVFVRSWVSAQRSGDWRVWGYRVQLPISAASDPSAVLVGHGRKAKIITKGDVVLRPTTEWQRVEISGEGSRVTITLNEAVVGAFDLEEFGGYVMLNNQKGRAEFRDISIESTEVEPGMRGDHPTAKEHEKFGGKLPRLIYEVRPNYTMDAMRHNVQGVVVMQAVVLPDGSVGPVRITRSLHRNLDLSAIAAVRAWRFAPATLNDQPVAVWVDIEMTFTLRMPFDMVRCRWKLPTSQTAGRRNTPESEFLPRELRVSPS